MEGGGGERVVGGEKGRGGEEGGEEEGEMELHDYIIYVVLAALNALCQNYIFDEWDDQCLLMKNN